MDNSLLDVDGPPSSPFVTEVEGQSRSPSKQWMPNFDNTIDEENECLHSPTKSQKFPVCMEDKENCPHEENTATLKKVFESPQTTPGRVLIDPNAPDPRSVSKEGRRRSSADAGMMPPPPSMQKNRNTPEKSPSKRIPNATQTPLPLNSGNSHEEHRAYFQAGLDMQNNSVPTQDAVSVDDTCFSTFSEVPEMTLFAKLGQSPTKPGNIIHTPRGMPCATPRTTRKRSSPSRSPSPTPQRQKTPAVQNQDGTTCFLIDFTQQIETVSNYRAASPGKASTESNLLQFIQNQRSPNKPRHVHATPNKSNNILSLLDFELPPPPTPRSVPTITVRELESLKSTYLSQISSLKATLSGREAEVESLKRAVGDAERRAGETQEALREERSRREHVEQEKAGWEKRGQEVESVLRNVKAEILKSEAEKEELIRKIEEIGHRAEEAEARAVKAEERFAEALAARADGGKGNENAVNEQVQRLYNAHIDAKIEQVSRELHSVYKEKHERKVATLKRSYEARNEKKITELQSRLASLEKQNVELMAARDATYSGPVQVVAADVQLKAQLEEQKAAFSRLEHELATSRQQQDQLMRELQQERIEKGDLVAAVDEMLALQAETGSAPQGAVGMVEDFRKSISRPPSALRAPGVSRIGGPGGLTKSVNGGKSKMLANIERMGRQGISGGPSAME
ncbi:hypothetical protein M433DRAFT_5377 [Acidomyces richmondensis BFW]|nr:MAG: hypothetical protein FE78DRAFT_33249 [Acidomyces sp. 'richmondensis']KYG44519.1 hypothetical protein M433DRAFT_5377 [Acidomyces richmondensis BFW]